jgi:hypothetical protein
VFVLHIITLTRRGCPRSRTSAPNLEVSGNFSQKTFKSERLIEKACLQSA